MLRGTKVRINKKVNPKHLKGTVGYAMDRSEKTGHIQVLHVYKGFWMSLWFPEDNIDILEPPIEL